MNEDYKKQLERQGFRIQEMIGSGLSGGTYRALQQSLNRSVAVKFFDSKFNKNNEGLRKRFVRESSLLSELQHPSIPYVLTKGTVNTEGEDVPYIVMEYISGLNLDEYIKKYGVAGLDSVLHISFQLLGALEFVHGKGIVHRDVKPSNIMILNSGHCYLIDFSIGFQQEGEAGMTRATKTGDHLGSVAYMSPEQTMNMKDVDGRSDLYSLTKVICELLSGKPEISGLNELSADVNPAIKNVLEKACEYSADNRHITASDFLRELKQASSSVSQFVGTPSKAVCVSKVCSGADWSEHGYYKGPNFIPDSTNAFCTSCGDVLMYKCRGCGHPIENTPYCGGCGTEQFSVPECETCGSFLQKEDMGKNTGESGCSKCRRKAEESKSQLSAVNPISFDDDIPF